MEHLYSGKGPLKLKYVTLLCVTLNQCSNLHFILQVTQFGVSSCHLYDTCKLSAGVALETA
jgi:hypothetical protein